METWRHLAVSGARSIARRAGAHWARDAIAQRYYRTRLTQPIDPNLAVYAAYWGRGYVCNPRAIYEAARQLVPEVRGVWLVTRDHARHIPPGVEYVIVGTRAYYDAMARAAVYVNNVNFADDIVKRPETLEVQTHHGTPLKHMALDLRGKALKRNFSDFDALLRRVERWDISISSNRHSTEIWERVYPGTYESLEVGYPRNDVLVRATDADVARARAALGIGPDHRVVLYAPTFRDNEPGYVPRVDFAALTSRLGSEWVVLARQHHRYEPDSALARLQAEGRLIDVASHQSVEELQLAADVLVTDYSSIMFDYATLDRPIVIHAPDWEEYRDSRGVYFDLLAEPPGVVTRTNEELVHALAADAAWSVQAAELRAVFRSRFCSLERGDASERVVRRVWGDRATRPAHP